MKGLLIAEKPSLMRDIERAYRTMEYPDELDFAAFVGHVMELKKPGDYREEWKEWKEEHLPIIPSMFEYQPKEQTKDVYQRIVDLIHRNRYDYLINACDAGREGELIFHAFYSFIQCRLPVKRLWISDTTTETIQKGLLSLLDHDDPSLTRLRQAAEGRAMFDWLIGMNASQACSLRAKKTIPIGRVMTPTLAIVVQREKEIQAFTPSPYWVLEALFAKGESVYSGVWVKEGESKITRRDQAEALRQRLEPMKQGQVVDVQKEQKTQYAPSLHSLLELQKEANKVFGYSAQETLTIAQSLYEKHKIITYPRTESKCLSTALAKTIVKHIQALKEVSEVSNFVDVILTSGNIERVMRNKKYVNDHQVTDHHAIIPTTKTPELQVLSSKEKNVYLLIVKRFLSIFLPPFVFEKTVVFTEIGGERFRSEGKTVIDQGYMALYPPKKESRDEEQVVLPPLEKGDLVQVKRLELKQKETTPPPRYDDSSLLQAMANAGRFVEEDEWKTILKETAGLGTSATRAGIIEKLVERGFIEKKGKVYQATPFGIEVVDMLQGLDVVSPVLTAQWEKKLHEIENGQRTFASFQEEMVAYTKELTNRLFHMVRPVSKISKGIGICPKCKHVVIETKKSYVCTEYNKTCDFVVAKQILGATVSPQEMKRLLEGKPTKTKTFTWKNGKQGRAKLLLKEGALSFVFETQRGA
ncbi:type IA DNA topoisomerase [Geobacillus subterraneus]|uniref:DNA topoisomerase n=1 Tax=Geobacillus subterraneus TaxID=129338 RepID=A0A679FVC3_9BACL|nr:type IA DNA topoisomerase [Geobacillus subterraneus]BBW98929.1 DNA topoisomerase [Geobacillus subterraneus]